MFQFGFSREESQNFVNETPQSKENVSWLQSEQILPEQIIKRECLKVNSIKVGDHTVKYIPNEEILNILRSTSNDLLLNTEQSHSDLITAVYEGGLKVWECTYDLLNFINESPINVYNKRILDLGCGAGIVGILSCLKGAETTCFQDYNGEVIKYVTGTNVMLNQIPFDKCKFYSGDWESFLHLLKETLGEENKFDYIFTSETIYNTDNYIKLLNIFKHLLKNNGCVYLAAKYYYFGVGGGISQFEDMLQKSAIFDYSTAWLCSEGVKRAILKITFKQ